jgi:hypothetical protein
VWPNVGMWSSQRRILGQRGTEPMSFSSCTQMEEALKERLLEVGVLDFVHATHAQLDQRHRRFHQCNVNDLEQDWETRLGRQSEWIGLSPFVDPLLMWVSPVEVGVEVSQDAVLLSIVSREIDTELRVEVLVIDKNISLVGGVFAESHITVKAIRTVAGWERAMSDLSIEWNRWFGSWERLKPKKYLRRECDSEG